MAVSHTVVRPVAAVSLAVGLALIVVSAAFGARSRGHASFTCPSLPCGPIQHIVIIVRENHSYDNLFGLYPGGDGTAWAHVGMQSKKMVRTPDLVPGDLVNTSAATRVAINGGKMNLFDKTPGAIQNGQDMVVSTTTSRLHEKPCIPSALAYPSW